MNNFYISVSNGLLSADHRERIGSALWEFMWCLDKITKIEKGVGYVLGGKPINLSDIATQLGVEEMTVSRNLQKLEEESYLKKRRTPYGLVIMVLKAKKRFNKKDDSPNGNVDSRNENVESNKTVSVDSTDDIPAQGAKEDEIKKFIDLFKPLNATYGYIFGRKNQRDAAKRLLKLRPIVEWEKVMKFIASRIEDKYCPRISSPIQLETRYADLEKYAATLKASTLKTKSNVAF